jgi:hypothetical protein
MHLSLVVNLAFDLALALAYLHGKRIFVRTLSPDKLTLNRHFRLLIK